MVSLFIGAAAHATTLINANFESSTSATLANDSPNRWCRGTATAYSGSYSLYISEDNCATNTYQGLFGSSVSHAYWIVNFPAGETNINLSFNWRCGGEVGYDDLKVYYQYSNPVAGSEPSGTLIGTFLGQTTWQSTNLNLPSSLAGQSGVRIIFTWRNDWNLGTEPPAAIDNVVLTSSAPASPSNDECAGAVTLTPAFSCNPTNGTVLGAGASSGVPACVGTPNNDVWYKFTAVSDRHNVTVAGSSGFDAVLQVFSGSCSNLTSLACKDESLYGGTETATLTGLTIGSTYYVRVYDWYAVAPSTPTFTISVTSPPPSNDECAGAVTLTPASSCNPTNGTVSGATASSGVPTCVGTPNNDVWYKFTATSTQHLINVEGESDFDAVIQAFSGTCGSLVSIGCRDGGYEGDEENLTLNGLSVGQTYYIRVYHYFTAAPTTPGFNICVTTPETDCSNPIVVDAVPYTHTGSTEGTGNNYGSQSCNSYYGGGNDVVYRLDADQAGRYNITVQNTSTSYYGFIGWFVKEDGLCSNTSTWVACAVSDEGTTASGYFDAPSPGTYYIIIDYYDWTGGNEPLSSDYSLNITRSEMIEGSTCGSARQRTAPFSETGTTCASANNYQSLCNESYGGEDFVYRITIPQAGEYFFQLNNVNNTGWVTAVLKSACDGACLMHLPSLSASTVSGSYTFSAPGEYFLILDSWAFPNCYNYSLTVSLPSAVVWPGDADNDGTVTVFDLFLAASGYGRTGPARTSPGSNWQGYAAGELWGTSTLYRQATVNNVYLDANGDGVVNLFDVALTVQHRGLTR